jgi:iron complex outermembrane receptor protein
VAAVRFLLRLLTACAALWLATVVTAATPVDFDLPAQPAADALLAFSRQAGVEVLFSFDELKTVQSTAVAGQFEPDEALRRLLRDTGFAARRSFTGKYVVARAKRPTGAVAGRLVAPEGGAAPGVTVVLVDAQLRTTTDAAGAFLFPAVSPGRHRLAAGGGGWRVLEQADIVVEATRTTELPPLALAAASGITELEPYLVRDRDARLPIGEGVGAAPRRAAGNLDLPRTEDNAMPFTVFSREQITRSGVVQLNEFFQRELLDGGSNSPPPEQSVNDESFVTGSSNLGLRGYGSDQTVVLLNGRRLPETFTEGTGMLGAPDVNLVPVSLVQQVEVLPVSASALYSGNAVGGVINIVLRDFDGTEIRTTYTNALGGFDAPQASVSLQYGKTLLDGRLRLRLNGTFTRAEPAVESELRLQQARLARTAGFTARATPNIASANGTPLFPGNPAAFTSVAPGADGGGGLGAYAGREGVYNTDSFDAPGGLAASINALDNPYGREQQRTTWYGSMVYDARPWLQVGLDAHYANTVVHRGYELFNSTLRLPAGAGNPFGQEVTIALNEFAPALGQDYNEARIESYAAIGGLLFKLPENWQVSLDGQYARNVARYRGTLGADPARWQRLVDAGRYNPLRDTQVFAPPEAFYDEAIIYYGGPGQFVTLGDYETFEGTVRLTNESLPLPTGAGTVNLGTDYRLGRLAPYLQEPRFADGTPAPEIIPWSGRTLERISLFGELQGPLWPAKKLPHPLVGAELDLGLRYIVSTQSNETSFAPTIGLKLDFAGGFAFRGSYTTSNRFPTPIMSRPLASGSGGGSTSDTTPITDPARNNEQYEVEATLAVNPNVRPENAATQSFGVIWQRGKIHRVRASLDFADTRKTNEFITLGAQTLVDLEEFYPDRVLRQTPPPPGTPAAPPRITTILTGPANAANRHSQNWSFAGEYSWREFAGGSLDLRARWVHFQRYDLQREPGGPVVDELDEPSGLANQLLRDRLTFGAGWSQPLYGFGVDAHYLGRRQLPEIQWAAQGSDHVKDYWQLDVYGQTDLTRWLPRRPDRLRLTAQLRINNLSGFDFPKYVNDPSGASVQPYGDWRGRTYSFSFAAEF